MSRPIGIIAPMPVEAKPLLARVSGQETTTYAGLACTQCTIGSVQTVVAVSGVGKVNMAAATQALIDKYGVSTVILTGVAGAIVKDLRQGDVIVATTLHQFDVTILRHNRYSPVPVRARSADGKMSRVTCFTASAELVSMALSASSQPRNSRAWRIREGPIATGDPFLLWPRALETLNERFGAMAVEMEGAALAQVASANGVPFCVIRGISDYAPDLHRLDLERVLAAQPPRTWMEKLMQAVSSSHLLVNSPANLNLMRKFVADIPRAAENAATVTLELVRKMSAASSQEHSSRPL